ncbi:MAG: hypothetical protein H3C43_00705 [Leptonema sp. (in: Bacteria)]|nr:hypothetical protein [Leptonema sp. (in: bacteria)]
MKSKLRFRWLFSIVLLFVCSTMPLLSQAYSPMSVEEKRPTTKDPAYRPPSVPPYLRTRSSTQVSAAERFFLNPDNRSEDDPLRAAETKPPEPMHPFAENRIEQQFKLGEDRRYIERQYLPQFGWQLDPDSHNPFYGETHYQESKVERGRNIFLMSSPFTFGLSYGLVLGYRRIHGLPTGFNGPQTAVVLGLGTILSGLIVWYDYKSLHSKSNSQNLNSFARELQKSHKN